MKLILLKLMSHIPRNLPVGMSAFYKWSDRIIALAGPLADKDSMRYVLASHIMHMDSKKSKASDAFFVSAMRKAAANQVAGQVFQDIKQKQIDAAKAAQEAANQPVEATTPQVEVADDGSKEK